MKKKTKQKNKSGKQEYLTDPRYGGRNTIAKCKIFLTVP